MYGLTGMSGMLCGTYGSHARYVWYVRGMSGSYWSHDLSMQTKKVPTKSITKTHNSFKVTYHT